MAKQLAATLKITVARSLYDEIKTLAAEMRWPMSTFCDLLLRQGVRNWDPDLAQARQRRRGRTAAEKAADAEWPSGWPKAKKCWKCSRMHDPLEHPDEDERSVRMVLASDEWKPPAQEPQPAA